MLEKKKKRRTCYWRYKQFFAFFLFQKKKKAVNGKGGRGNKKKKVTKQTLCWLKTLFSKQRERERERCAEYSKTQKKTPFFCFVFLFVLSLLGALVQHAMNKKHIDVHAWCLSRICNCSFFSLPRPVDMKETPEDLRLTLQPEWETSNVKDEAKTHTHTQKKKKIKKRP